MNQLLIPKVIIEKENGIAVISNNHHKKLCRLEVTFIDGNIPYDNYTTFYHMSLRMFFLSVDKAKEFGKNYLEVSDEVHDQLMEYKNTRDKIKSNCNVLDRIKKWLL